MNSETVRPMPPRRLSKRRNEMSVTPAIGERIKGGLISTSRILNGRICTITNVEGHITKKSFANPTSVELAGAATRRYDYPENPFSLQTPGAAAYSQPGTNHWIGEVDE